MSKTLTIALPTYNRGAKIANLLDFLYNEFLNFRRDELKNIAIYISDNCSTDDTKDKILNSKLVKENIIDYEYSCNSENIGLLGNLKKIYSLPLGEYLWMMGDDDTYKPGIVKKVYDACSCNKYSYIFINHSIVENGNVLKESVLGNLDSMRTDKSMLLDLYFQSNTVMMFMSACIYRTKYVNDYIKKYTVDLVAPCSLSFYCASQGESKYISEPMIIDSLDGISWSEQKFNVFHRLIPKMLIKLPLWGYVSFRCYKRALGLYLPVIKRNLWYK